MKYRTLFSTLLLASLLTLHYYTTNAQSPPPARDTIPILDAFMIHQMDKHNLPGMEIAVTQGEDIVYLNALGGAGEHRPLTPRTPMVIGSASEAFTALAIAQLAERGLLDMNAPVRNYLPWFRVDDEVASANLTISHFAHHVSGLSEEGYSNDLHEDTSIADAVRTLANARLTQPMGDQTQYFGMNYVVLAAVIEATSKQTYRQYLDENILQPLDMADTYLSLEEATVNGLAQGYSRFLGFTFPVDQPFDEYKLPTCCIIPTARGMAHFVVAMNNQGRYEDSVVLSPQGMRNLFDPYPAEGFQFGIGWFIDSSYGFDRYQHSGATEGYISHMALFPQHDLGLVVLVNQGYLLDAYTSTPQLFNGIEHILLTGQYPDDTRNFSMRIFNIGFLVFFLLLAIYQGWQLLGLFTWRSRVTQMTRNQHTWDIGLTFLVPTIILIAIFLGLRPFLDNQVNPVLQSVGNFSRLPDVILLILVGTLPDYIQGLVKLAMLLTERATRLA